MKKELKLEGGLVDRVEVTSWRAKVFAIIFIAVYAMYKKLLTLFC